MSHRFFVNDPLTGQQVELDDQEARHLRDVLRLKVSGEVELFNGLGVVAAGRIAKATKRSVEVEILSRQTLARPSTSVTIASAVPKGERFRWMVEKLTELNVSRLIPLKIEHSVVAPGETKLQRMRQIVISAAKQCGRNHLMAIDPLTDWRTVVEGFGPTLIIADPQGAGPSTVVGGRTECVLGIGPEAGFTADELRLATKAGATTVCFSDTILRIETAAIAAAVVAATMKVDKMERQKNI